MLDVVKHYPEAIKHVGDKLRHNNEFMQKAIEINEDVASYLEQDENDEENED